MKIAIVALVALVLGLLLGVQLSSEGDAGLAGAARTIATEARHAAMKSASGLMDVDMRERVLLEHPELIDHIGKTGGFGGEFSRSVAQNMFGRLPESIEDAKAN